MFDNDTLAQLKQVKADIRQHQKRFQGVVSGSQQNFGFVRTDEGQQYFLPPPEMNKTFPGDRIEFQLHKDSREREYAAVEKLISTELKSFCGKCIQHGKAWFVEMDVPRMTRKLFLPPPQRKGVSPGDWLQCRVSRHPFKEGKGQASVTKNLGQDKLVDFPSRYAALKFDLSLPAREDSIDTSKIEAMLQARTDCSEIPFASIDPPDSRDIDDALFAARTDSGWDLVVAIADPASIIDLHSPLAKAALSRAATAYLPHQQLPMLPAQLSENLLSLLERQRRLAVLCKLTVAESGQVTDARFEEVTICNRVQLSYDELNDYFARDDFAPHIDSETRQSLEALRQVTERMRQWRGEHQLLFQERPEFEMKLGSDGRIAAITQRNKGVAHGVVEECMVATNQAASRQLADFGGIFSTHAGFRSEKLGDAAGLLKAAGFDAFNKPGELNQLDCYLAAIHFLDQHPEHGLVKNILSRFLQRANLAPAPLPHLGLGVSSYMGFTSPLRRYADLFNHCQLKLQLAGKPTIVAEAPFVEQLELQMSRLRSASYWAEQWLRCDYLMRNPTDSYQGKVVQANPFGAAVRLEATGIEGIVEKRCLPENLKFDSAHLRFGVGDNSIGLGDTLSVKVKSIELDRGRILFERCTETN